jgi:GAF domain-containing protein
MDRDNVDADVASISRIAAVPRILDAVIELTGMRFAAVARVTEASWTACAIRDELGFGLAPGQGLVLESTICNEIRQHGTPVVFGHASLDPHFSQHHTPKQYGLESYLSVPIFRVDGTFFGTLCAIDSRPADLHDPLILKTVELFAELIGRQLEVEEHLATSRQELHDFRERSALRDQLITAVERDIRDLFQPIVTGLYLLRTSPTLLGDDRDVVAQMEECCEQVSLLLRDNLDRAYGRIEGQVEQPARIDV